MTFDARLTRLPRPHDPARGDEARAAAPWARGATAELIAGAGGSSPYLAGLIATEAGWLEAALDDPEAALARALEVGEAPPADLGPALRQAKRRVALLAALCDLGGVWPLEVVTGALTDLADRAVQAALTTLVAAEVARGKLPSGGDPAEAGGMVALAMGKMGAGELNYSSDIDLILLFDETRFDPDDYHEVRAAFIRVTRRMTALLSEVTAQGYVFRTDLRLRPDAAVTPVCLSMEAAERYYESVGRTWERAAYIKARACAGDLGAGARFLETLRPFVWRKHLDFAAIQDAHDMRLKIRDHKGLHGPLVLEGHDMKLGRGGIREIEFFTQTRQLIAGGRDPSLRVRGTVEGLARLAAAGWVPEAMAQSLTEHYRAHREVEHRLQMVNDAQTHALPGEAEGFARLAALSGRETGEMRADLTRRIEAVDQTIEGFFAPEEAAPAGEDWGEEITARWPTYPALRSERGRAVFRRLRPELLARLSEAARPEEALVQFDGFLAGLPAGVQLFSLFEAHPDLTRLIVDIAATAPALAQYLSRNAGVFDAVIGGSFFAGWPGAAGLTEALLGVLAGAGDYEAQLDAARRWQKEWHFRVGVHHLRGLIDADGAAGQYADLAQATVAGLWPAVAADFARKHGPQPGQGAVVLGMGSLGAGRLNAGSDLDLIVIYDAPGIEASEGPRPLPTRSYFARLTQALVTALSAPMAQGRLYEVDMRLRPSGRQGPVATARAAFEDYQRNEAWTWEHLALTRARGLAGAPALLREVEEIRRAVLAEKAHGPKVPTEVAEMRARLREAKPAQGLWEAKAGPGRLQDCELFAQTAALRAGHGARDTVAQLAAGLAAGWLTPEEVQPVREAADLFWRLQAAARLLTGGPLDPEALGEGGRRFVLRETGLPGWDALAAEIETRAARADAVITAKLESPHA